MTIAANDLVKSLKLSMLNTGLIAKGFDFVREQALGHYPHIAMVVSDRVREFAKFIGSSDVEVNYNLETYEHISREHPTTKSDGRIVTESVVVTVSPDVDVKDAMVACDLVYYEKGWSRAGLSDMPELRREGFNLILNKFFDANKGRAYVSRTFQPAEGERAPTYQAVAVAQHVRNMLASIPLSNYKLYAEIANDELKLCAQSRDEHFLFTVKIKMGNVEKTAPQEQSAAEELEALGPQ